MMKIAPTDYYSGAILGAAIGDAMGCPTEFLSMSQIEKRYGANGVTGFVLYKEADGKRFAPYTDDTQLAEMVLISLLAEKNDLNRCMEIMGHNFIQWSNNPQGGHRAPGRACLQGCANLAQGVHWSIAGGEQAGGCGSVMRSYPFGLVFCNDLDKAEQWAVAHSYLTHRDPIALAACAAMAIGTAMAIQQCAVKDILNAMAKASARYSQETAYMINQAISKPLSYQQKVMNWYLGWAAHEAIAAAAYLFCHYARNPELAILSAANTPGDSDSIATLVGALTGAYNGLNALPAHWVQEVERSTELLNYGSQLANLKVQ